MDDDLTGRVLAHFPDATGIFAAPLRLRPFTWTKTADQIIDGICRYCSRLSGPAH